MTKKRIMVVEDEGITAMNIKSSLEDIGYAVTSISVTGEDAVDNAVEDRPDLILMDIILKGEMNGIEAAEQIRAKYDIPIVYLTAYSDEAMIKRIKKTEPAGYIVKPFDEKELRIALEIGFYKHEMESRLKESENRFREVVEGTGDLVTTVDGKGDIVYINHVAERIFGVKADKCIGMSAFKFIHPDDRQATIEWFADAVKKRLEQASMENRQVNQMTGEVHYMLWTANVYYDDKGNVVRVNSIANDITDRKIFEEQLKTKAITDDLTGLFNRRGFFMLADQQRKLVNRTKRPMLLLYLDIDGFKNINDELGHSEGDRALIDTGDILKQTFRESDIVARIGGDEFAVLLTEYSGPDVESLIIDNLISKVKEFNDNAGREYELLFSVGIVSYDNENTCSIDELLMRADELMYKDKKSKLLQSISATMLSEEERRGSERYTPVENRIVEIDGTFNGEIKDISYSGTCLKSSQHVDIEDVHSIKVDSFSLTGLVVWTSLKGENTRKEKKLSFYETGFRFINLKRNKKALLKSLIDEIKDQG